MSPTVADYRTRNRLILLTPVIDRPSVTAEVASPSLVVPGILFKHLQENDETSIVRHGAPSTGLERHIA